MLAPLLVVISRRRVRYIDVHKRGFKVPPPLPAQGRLLRSRRRVKGRGISAVQQGRKDRQDCLECRVPLPIRTATRPVITGKNWFFTVLLQSVFSSLIHNFYCPSKSRGH